MTRERVNAKGEGMMFTDVQEVHRAYESRHAELQAKVKVRITEYVKNEDGGFRRASASSIRPWVVRCCPRSCRRACRSMP